MQKTRTMAFSGWTRTMPSSTSGNSSCAWPTPETGSRQKPYLMPSASNAERMPTACKVLLSRSQEEVDEGVVVVVVVVVVVGVRLRFFLCR